MKKVLPPEKQSIGQVAREYGINDQTIRNWVEQVNAGILELDAELGPAALGNREKFQLVLEATGIPEEEFGGWIREKGLHSEHLQLWQQELREATEKDTQHTQELREAKKRIQQIEKEPNRTDKALAKMAALITLKKNSTGSWRKSRTTDTSGNQSAGALSCTGGSTRRSAKNGMRLNDRHFGEDAGKLGKPRYHRSAQRCF
ncbi:MAG TPA: transposase [Spirochaetia bacterium]|nr:transposase [Spirochaetia bacterium]